MALTRWERLDWPDLFRRFFESDLDTSFLRVEEFQEGDNLVIRAELPGIDPDKDVELSVADDTLHIRAHREEKSEHKEKESYRSEFRYGSFDRTIPLPRGSTLDAVKASYSDGVLEVRVPMAKEEKVTRTRVPITRG